jgi:hypothetical protein
VARDEVAAERVAEAQGGLEVDAAADLRCAEAGAREGLERGLDGEVVLGRGGDREAHAGDADAGAEDAIGLGELRGDDEGPLLGAAAHGLDAADRPHQPGEHAGGYGMDPRSAARWAAAGQAHRRAGASRGGPQHAEVVVADADPQLDAQPR